MSHTLIPESAHTKGTIQSDHSKFAWLRESFIKHKCARLTVAHGTHINSYSLSFNVFIHRIWSVRDHLEHKLSLHEFIASD
jgi:hypothetical protein